jgi:DNA-binding CsgD family transcriptional regulator
MIDATASLQAAEQISAATLIDYLRATGWSSRPSRVDGIEIFSKHISGADNPVQFILPVEPALPEERLRVADALRTISQIERCSEAEVANEVRQTTRGPVSEADKSVANLPTHLRTLTPREREILDLISSGRQSKQIAAKLGISVTTIRFHQKSIMEKMAAGSLADLVRKAQTLGIRNKS